MSYERNPYYIWSDGENLHFDGVEIPESAINVFLYKLFLLNREEDLKNRLLHGKETLAKNYAQQDPEYLEKLRKFEGQLLTTLLK